MKSDGVNSTVSCISDCFLFFGFEEISASWGIIEMSFKFMNDGLDPDLFDFVNFTTLTVTGWLEISFVEELFIAYH
jgi:hypothetical protein